MLVARPDWVLYCCVHVCTVAHSALCGGACYSRSGSCAAAASRTALSCTHSHNVVAAQCTQCALCTCTYRAAQRQACSQRDPASRRRAARTTHSTVYSRGPALERAAGWRAATRGCRARRGREPTGPPRGNMPALAASCGAGGDGRDLAGSMGLRGLGSQEPGRCVCALHCRVNVRHAKLLAHPVSSAHAHRSNRALQEQSIGRHPLGFTTAVAMIACYCTGTVSTTGCTALWPATSATAR